MSIVSYTFAVGKTDHRSKIVAVTSSAVMPPNSSPTGLSFSTARTSSGRKATPFSHAHRSKQEPIKAQVYKLFHAKATLRVENTTEDMVELIYEITQKFLRRAEQTTPDIPGSIYSLGSIDYVNLVMQNDEVSN